MEQGGGTKAKVKCGWTTDHGGEMGSNAAEYCVTEGCQQKECLLNSDQVSEDIWGRNEGYSEQARQTDWGERANNATMMWEWHATTKSGTSTSEGQREWRRQLMNYHRHTSELLQIGAEERTRAQCDKCAEDGHRRKRKIGWQKSRWEDAWQRDTDSIGLRADDETEMATWRRKITRPIGNHGRQEKTGQNNGCSTSRNHTCLNIQCTPSYFYI